MTGRVFWRGDKNIFEILQASFISVEFDNLAKNKHKYTWQKSISVIAWRQLEQENQHKKRKSNSKMGIKEGEIEIKKKGK